MVRNMDIYDVDSFNSYMNTIRKIPRITKEKEKELLKKYFEEEDLTAARDLIEGNLRIVTFVARRYISGNVSIMDLIQEGNIGLMRALKSFDYTLNTRFLTYAKFWVSKAMSEFVRKNKHIFRLATKNERKLFNNMYKYRKSTEEDITYSEIKEISKELKIPIHIIDTYLIKTCGSFSLDSADNTIRDMTDAVTDMEDREEQEFNMAAMYRAMNSLSPRYCDIIKRRYLEKTPVTLIEIAEEQGVSFQRIAQIEKLALKQLNLAMRENTI